MICEYQLIHSKAVYFINKIYLYIQSKNSNLNDLFQTQKVSFWQLIKKMMCKFYHHGSNFNFIQLFEPKLMTEKKLVKRTTILVKIQDIAKDMFGIVKFPSENSNSHLGQLSSSINYHKSSIAYKNQLMMKRDENEEQEQKKGREVQNYQLTIRQKNNKSKQYKAQIPIVRGYKGIRAMKSKDIYFSFYFSNSEGHLTLMHSVVDAKVQNINKLKTELPYKQRLQIQLSKMDNRRKQELDQSKFKIDDQQES